MDKTSGVQHNIAELNKKMERIINYLHKSNLITTQSEEYLTISETSKLLKVTRTTVGNWTEQGIIKKYSIGNKILYKRSELEKSIVRIN